MYSLLISKIANGYQLCNDFLKDKLNSDSKVVILPWAFPTELDSDRFSNEYFKKGNLKYNKYVLPLLDLGVLESNIFIANPYRDSKEQVKHKIEESDCLILPGGNPEMLFQLVAHKYDLLYDIKYYRGLIIGESAGAELHLKRYFITAKNNYYKYFAFYDGFGILNDPFYFDVHTINNHLYLEKLRQVAKDSHKKVYAIYDNGAIIINRKNNNIMKIGEVKEFDGK